MRRLLTVALAGVLAVPVGVVASAPRVAAMVAPCQRVAVIGGSITVGTVTPQGQEFVELGILNFRIDAKVSRRITTKTGGITTLKAMRAKGYDPDCIVIGLGNNDVPARSIASIYEGWITKMMDAIGPGPRVLWINLYRKPFRKYDIGFNAALEKMVTVYPNLHVGDWSRVITAHLSWMTRDGIHLTATGKRERSRWTAQQVHEVLQGGGPTGPPPASCPVATVPLQRRMTGPDVLCLEQRLRQLRWFTKTPDARFESATKTALIAWQKRHGLAGTGVLDASTRSALGLG